MALSLTLTSTLDNVLGRLSFAWEVSGNEPAGGYALSIIKSDGSTERTLSYASGVYAAPQADFNGLAIGTYAAVLTAKDADNKVVASAVATGLELTKATSIGGVSAVSNNDGSIDVAWTAIEGYAGNYNVFLNGVPVVTLVDSSYNIAFTQEQNATIVIKASILAENDTVSEPIESKMDKQVVISDIQLAQNAEQAAQGLGVVSWSAEFASSDTTYMVEASGVDVAHKIEFAAFQSGDLLNFGKAGQYLITVKAVNTGDDTRDNGVMASAEKTVAKQLEITGLAAKYNAAGMLVLEADDMKFAVGVQYDASVNGVSYPMTLDGDKFKTAPIAGLADSTYPFVVKATNNGEQALGESSVTISTGLAFSGLAADARLFPSRGSVKLSWSDSRAAADLADAAVVYNYNIKRADTLAQVASGSKSVTAAGQIETEALSLSGLAGSYIARVEFTANGRSGHDEIAFVLKANEMTLALAPAVEELATDAHKLMLSSTLVGDALVDYHWEVVGTEASGNLLAQAGSLDGHELLAALEGLNVGSYTLRVSALWYGANKIALVEFAVAREIAAVQAASELRLTWAAPTGMAGASYEVSVIGAQGRVVQNAVSPLILRDMPIALAGYEVHIVASKAGKTVTYTVKSLANGASRSVKVNLRAEIEADGRVNVFEAADLIEGNIVVAEEGLPASALYTMDSSEGLIQFWEPANASGDISGEFTVDMEGADRDGRKGPEHAADLLAGIHAALVGQLNASEAEPFARFAAQGVEQYYRFAGIGKMALAYSADRLFGHPAATAAITNDAAIIAAMENDASNNEFSSAMAAASAANAKLARRLVEAMLFHGDVAARAKSIVSAVIGQDSDRARGQDNNLPAPEQKQVLRFYPGDEVYFQIKFKGFQAARNGVAATGTPNDAALTARLTEQPFLFKCVLQAPAPSPL